MTAVRQRGVTLVELMVSMALGLVMIGGAIGLFAQVKRSYSENERVLRMQDDARFALAELSRDIAATGFWGELSDAGSVVNDASLAIGVDCGSAGVPWAFDLGGQISTLDNPAAAAAAAAYGCLDAAVVRADSDIVAIKRTSGNTTPAPLTPGTVYLRSNGVVGMLYRHPETVPPAILVPPPASEWRYAPSLWYVRTHASDTDRADGIPTLCRKRLDDSAVPSMADECIARGVETMQLEFGLDDDGDGGANRYVHAPSAAELTRLVSVRISLLVRSTTPQTGYTNEKSYRVGNHPDYRPADSFYRRVYSATVNVRNLGNQTRFGI